MWRTRRGGLRILSLTAEANLDCAFVENTTFLHRSLIVKSQQNRIEIVTTPGHVQPEDSATQTRKARRGFLEGEEKMNNKLTIRNRDAIRKLITT